MSPAAKTSTKPASKGRSLTAAAQVLKGRRIDRVIKPRGSQALAWQNEAWDFYDKIGEFSWGVDQQAWAVSQLRLISARDLPNQDEPDVVTGETDDVDEEADPPSEADIIAADLVAGFAGGTSGQQQLMRRIATQLIVSAESYIVGRAMGTDVDDVWEAYSRDEVKWNARGWKVDDGVDKFDLGPDDVLIRVWIPHPRRKQEARSGTKALLPVLQEIFSLTQAIAALADSRLAGAGLLFLPKSVEVVGSSKAGDDDEDDEDQFINDLIDMVITPIKDRGSAAAMVPFIAKVDDDALGKIQYIRFESQVDMAEAEKREKAMIRLARGMDMSPEQLLGMGDVNHWGTWQIGEADVKGPISSLGSIIVHALTIGWYRPALETAFEAANLSDEDMASIDDRMVWFDRSPLEQRPDLGERALQVFDRGGLSLTALVRESGFDTADMPTGPELCRVLLLLLVKAAPQLAAPLLATLGDCAGIGGIEEMFAEAAPEAPADQEEDVNNPQDRALPERPATAVPDEEAL
jgi:hypothetical protein